MVKAPTSVHHKAPAARQHQIYGIAGPQLPGPTSAPVQQNAIVARQPMQKGFVMPKAAKMPVSRMPAPRMPEMSVSLKNKSTKSRTENVISQKMNIKRL
jgi:hypothetical protein